MSDPRPRGDVPAKHVPRPTAAAVGGSAKKKQARFSREETRSRILDAAEDLFSRRDPAKVTVREIAEAAGVTHPLVHQYVGSKSEILEAVIARGAPHRHRMIAEHPVYRELMPELFADVLDHRIHTQAIVRSAMDGAEYAPFEDRLKTGRMLLELARAERSLGTIRLPAPAEMDPRIVLAAATALAYGWVATEEWLIPIFDLGAESPEDIRAQLNRILQQITELSFPVADAGVEDS